MCLIPVLVCAIFVGISSNSSKYIVTVTRLSRPVVVTTTFINSIFNLFKYHHRNRTLRQTCKALLKMNREFITTIDNSFFSFNIDIYKSFSYIHIYIYIYIYYIYIYKPSVRINLFETSLCSFWLHNSVTCTERWDDICILQVCLSNARFEGQLKTSLIRYIWE